MILRAIILVFVIYIYHEIQEINANIKKQIQKNESIVREYFPNG